MAGYSKNREQNYEIKYLRKILGQVDSRIQVPQSIDASSLRALIDDVPAPRAVARRSTKPRWLSIQSAVVYAAAFALIVGLYYSARIYRPELIDGVMEISQKENPAVSIAMGDGAESTGDELIQINESILIPEPEPQGNIEQNQPTVGVEGADTVQPVAEDTAPRAFSADIPENVGGGGISTLLLEQDGLQYRERRNDITDPDNPSPVTFEIFNSETGELLTQVNVSGVQALVRCLVLDGKAVLIGHGEEDVSITVYDGISNLVGRTSLLYGTTITGSLADAQIYGDIAYIATVSDEAPDNVTQAEALPNSTADGSCSFTAINLSTLEAAQKAFTGANGMVQLSGEDAYIHYSGVTASGETETYITRIVLDGMDIIMGSGR